MDRDDTRDRRAVAARQRALALQMSREGTPIEAIATRLGVTRGTARRMIGREARQMVSGAGREDRRLVHVEALMELWRALYGPATAGDLPAIDRFLRVEERLALLLDLEPGARPASDGDGEAAEALERRFVRTQ